MPSVKATSKQGAGASGKALLALSCGDPCGVGPEIVLKAAASEECSALARLLVVGDEKLLRRTAREHKLKWPFAAVVEQAPEGTRWERPQLLDLKNVDPALLPGQISAQAGKASAEAIERAVALAAGGLVDGIVTAPIHKEALSLAGYSDPGHTEMLARLTGSKQVGMLFWSEEFCVALLTTHMSMKQALRKIRAKAIADKLLFFNAQWERWFGKRPHIGVAALNPHAGEGGRFGVEEVHEIIPALERVREKGLHVDGPVPADSIFAMARAGRYDLVFSLYHDQATVPVKLVCRQRSVNVTMGLPFIRTSVDHGTAMDIAGKGIASEKSLLAAIGLAARLSRSR